MRLAMARASLHGSIGAGSYTWAELPRAIQRHRLLVVWGGELCLKCFSLLLTEEISQVEHEPRPLVVSATVRPPDPPIQC